MTQISTPISYDHGVSDKKLIGETIGAFFDRAVETWRDREALVVRQQDVRWSWGELGRRVDDLAAGLLSLGLERGDRVGIWAPNRSEWTLAQFATAKAGLILVTINPAYRLSEAEYALNKAGCKALVTAIAHKTSEYLHMLRELAPELASAPPRISWEDRSPASRARILPTTGRGLSPRPFLGRSSRAPLPPFPPCPRETRRGPAQRSSGPSVLTVSRFRASLPRVPHTSAKSSSNGRGSLWSSSSRSRRPLSLPC